MNKNRDGKFQFDQSWNIIKCAHEKTNTFYYLYKKLSQYGKENILIISNRSFYFSKNGNLWYRINIIEIISYIGWSVE